MEIVHEIISLSYIERIGLRYLNAIPPRKNEKLTDYIESSLLGFSSLIGGNLKHNFIEGVTEIDNGTLVARTIIMDNGLALAPELSPIQLDIHQKFSSPEEKTATLDIDYFKNNRFDFDSNKIEGEIRGSHKIISNTFNSLIPRALARAPCAMGVPQGGEPLFSPLGRCMRIYFACTETNWEIPRPLAAGYFIL
jgi:uncharacterized protein (TIGR04255 family)